MFVQLQQMSSWIFLDICLITPLQKLKKIYLGIFVIRIYYYSYCYRKCNIVLHHGLILHIFHLYVLVYINILLLKMSGECNTKRVL